MAKIPVRFKRVAAAFDEVARARFCESSGSEYSPENSATDLYDLVNSFIERDERDEGNEEEEEDMNRENEGNLLESSDDFVSDSETKDILQSLLRCQNDDVLMRNIRAETELAFRLIGNSSSRDFKRQLMTRLRERGFDAGLCKSRWERKGRYPSGDYEYIDVNVTGTRYVVEVFLSGEFKIARPTSRYISLLELFPPIFVGKLEELRQIIRLMCAAVKESMKSMDMHLPPWRRNGYMQTKWFGSYKRTINAVPAKKLPESDEGSSKKGSVVGFEASTPAISYRCRDDFARKVGLRVGYLTAAFNGNGMQL